VVTSAGTVNKRLRSTTRKPGAVSKSAAIMATASAPSSMKNSSLPLCAQ
jgi:hypothetical protein